MTNPRASPGGGAFPSEEFMKWISNKTLFNLHGWLGLNFGLLLFAICFSGSLATLSSEADWLINADMRIETKDAPIRWEAMYHSLKEKYPEGKNLGMYKNTYAGHGDYFAAVAYMSLANGQTRKVYLNPYTGQIQGDTSFFNVQRFFRSYHRRFFDGERGIFLVTLSSFFLLFSALTGFLFYKGWLKNLFKLRLGQGVKKLFSDIHKLTGIWSLIFTLFIAVTGVFYFVELMFQAADNYEVLVPDEPPKIEKADLAQYGPNPELLSLDKYVVNAQKAFPELDVSSVRVPHRPDEYVYVDGQAGNPITRNRANKVYLHPFTGEVVHIQRSSELTTAEFITDIADPLHFGYFGGLTTKIIWFILGLIISFAILSGTYLWYVRGMAKMKRKLERKAGSGNRKENTEKEPDVAMAGFFTEYVTKSRGAVVSTVLVLMYLVYTGAEIISEGILSYGPLPVERITALTTTQLEPWEIELKCEYPCTFEEGTFQANFKANDLPNYISLSLEMVLTDSVVSFPFEGAAATPSIVKKARVSSSDVTQIILKAEDYDGRVYSDKISPSVFNEAEALMKNRFQSFPEKSYPEVPLTVYLYIAFFALLTISVLVVWTYFLIKATSQMVKLNTKT